MKFYKKCNFTAFLISWSWITACESIDGKILPFQQIYKGKAQRSFPTVDFHNGFFLLHNGKHLSNEKEAVCLIEQVLVPYIMKFKEEKGLPKTIKNVCLYGTLLKLNLWPMYLMFYQRTELNVLWYQRTRRSSCNHWI